MKKILLTLIVLILFSISVFAASRGAGGDTVKRANEQLAEKRAEVADSVEKMEEKKNDTIEKREIVAQKRNDVKRLTERIKEKLGKVDSSETGLKCGNLNTREERVKCRLKLEGEERVTEAKLQFLPEECRAKEGEERSRCIRVYKLSQECWENKKDNAIISCVKRNLGLEKPVKEEKEACRELEGEERASCIKNLKESVYDSIKFRFYNLEEKAERLLESGRIDENTVVKLVSDLEAKKIEFNEAKNLRDKKTIVNDVKEIWKEFVKAVRKYNSKSGDENES